MEKYTRGYLTLNNQKNNNIKSKIKILNFDYFEIIKINEKETNGLLLNGQININSEKLLNNLDYLKENENFDISSIEDEFVSNIKIEKKYLFIIRIKYDKLLFEYFKNKNDDYLGLRTVEDNFIALEKNSSNFGEYDLLIENLKKNNFEVDQNKNIVIELGL